MVFFKFSIIGGVILLSEIIERKRPGWGRFVLLVGCIGAAYAVFTGRPALHGRPTMPDDSRARLNELKELRFVRLRIA